MKIIAINRTKNAVPELPHACEVKLCNNIFQLVGKGASEKLVVTRKSEVEGIQAFKREVLKDNEDPFLYFAELESNLPSKLVFKVSPINHQGFIGDPVVEVHRGELFGGSNGSRVVVHGTSCVTKQDMQRFDDMMQMARFMAYEYAG